MRYKPERALTPVWPYFCLYDLHVEVEMRYKPERVLTPHNVSVHGKTHSSSRVEMEASSACPRQKNINFIKVL